MSDDRDQARDDAVRRRAYEISQGPEAASPLEDWTRAEHEFAVAHHYDTLAHDLERLGMTIARLPSEAGVVWRLTLPRGERLEAWEPGTSGLSPPREIMDVVGGILDGAALVPEPAALREPGAARLRELIGTQLQALLRHDPGVRVGVDPENLRKHRVAGRRMRAFLRVARAYTDPTWAEGIAGPLRELGSVSGPARDLDVLVAQLALELPALDEADRVAADALRRRLAADRAELQRRLREALDGESYRLLLTRLRMPPRFRPGVEDVPLERLARKEFRRLARSVAALGNSPGDAAVHTLRISLKRARYAAELSAPSGKAGRRVLAAAKALQDVLGEYQDAVVAGALLRSTTVRDESTAVAFVAGRLAERQAQRRARAFERLPAAWRRLRKRAGRL